MTLDKILKETKDLYPEDSSGDKFLFEFCKLSYKENHSAQDCFSFLQDKGFRYFTLNTIKKKFTSIEAFELRHPKKEDKKKRTMAEVIQIFENTMNTKYEFYFDCIKDQNYIRPKGSTDKFKVLSDRQLSSIWREFTLSSNGYLPISTVEQLINSGFFPPTSGIHQFISELPKYDGLDHIGNISKTIKTNDDENFADRFKRWFVGMVSTVVNEDVTNDLVLVLYGNQGIGKTRFFKKLLPEHLLEYYISDLPKMREKDTKIAAAEHLLFVVDEIDALTHSDNTAFKGLVTSPKVSVRKPYDKKKGDYKRYATFAGTSNRQRILTDTTGSRRFLCFKALSVDNEAEVNIDQAYAQAVDLIKNNYEYWLSLEEIAKQDESNEEFRFQEPEEELLLEYTQVPTGEEDDVDIHYFQTSTLLAMLYKLADVSRTVSNSSSRKLGAALTKHGYPRTSKNQRKVWKVVLLPSDLDPLGDNEFELITP